MRRRDYLHGIMLMAAASLILTSCHDHHSHDPGPGPDGRDGRAFFSINYEWSHPYSYWDNNIDVPDNPQIGFFYMTVPGIYEFEYFINPDEYWYGTYEIWIILGERGRPFGQPGLDGADNYFTLFCDPYGYSMDMNGVSYGKTSGSKDEIIIKREEDGSNMRIVMKKANVNDRKPHEPKARWSK